MKQHLKKNKTNYYNQREYQAGSINSSSFYCCFFLHIVFFYAYKYEKFRSMSIA